MSEQPKNDIVEILKKKRVASEKQKKHLLKCSILASQKRKADKIKLDMIKGLEENKVNIHQVLDDSREKKQKKLQKEPNETQKEPTEHIEPIKMEPINKQMEPIKISLRDKIKKCFIIVA